LAFYELAILGSPTENERDRLTGTLKLMIEPFGLQLGTDVILHGPATVIERDERLAFAGAYFAIEGGTQDLQQVENLIGRHAPVIPSIVAVDQFNHVPPILAFANGIRRRKSDPELEELAAAMLECAGLLSRQRRVFVSYRRTEARNAAVQLHDELTARGFDVFLDTHDIRPGEPFQEILFHRLVDCDVMVMLDTPTYFESRWTKEEIGRARAKEIQILRVIWPEHKPNRMTDLAETVYVDPDEIKGADGPFTDSLVDTIANHVESLRSRSIASRERTIVGKLKAAVGMIGGSIEGVGAYRAISLKLEDGRRLSAYPVVGIPTAEALHDVLRKAESAAIGEVPILVYDHVGIREVWLSHLKWLGEQIQAVRQIKVSEAGWALAGWQ
jgi:hypothetical protein